MYSLSHCIVFCNLDSRKPYHGLLSLILCSIPHFNPSHAPMPPCFLQYCPHAPSNQAKDQGEQLQWVSTLYYAIALCNSADFVQVDRQDRW
jgi:hypothetical protein